MGCRGGEYCSGGLPWPPAPKPRAQRLPFGLRKPVQSCAVPTSGHTEVRGAACVTKSSFFCRKLPRLRDSRVQDEAPEGHFPLDFALWRGQRAWALLCWLGRFGPEVLCLSVETRRHRWATRPKGALLSAEPALQGPAAARARGARGAIRKMSP